MRVLVVDIGGTNVKIHATGQKTPRKLTADWKYGGFRLWEPVR